MPHLVKSFCDKQYEEALSMLESAHHYLVEHAKKSLKSVANEPGQWGIQIKRTVVKLNGTEKPELIDKSEEKFVEIINLTATIERLISVIRWFSEQAKYEGLRIKQCHPSTSDEKDGNDLVLADEDDNIRVRCEVSDVASSNVSSNSKEKKDIKSLFGVEDITEDNIDRFICTAPEFAGALTNSKRKWDLLDYRYETVSLGDAADTRLLKILRL